MYPKAAVRLIWETQYRLRSLSRGVFKEPLDFGDQLAGLLTDSCTPASRKRSR